MTTHLPLSQERAIDHTRTDAHLTLKIWVRGMWKLTFSNIASEEDCMSNLQFPFHRFPFWQGITVSELKTMITYHQLIRVSSFLGGQMGWGTLQEMFYSISPSICDAPALVKRDFFLLESPILQMRRKMKVCMGNWHIYFYNFILKIAYHTIIFFR